MHSTNSASPCSRPRCSTRSRPPIADRLSDAEIELGGQRSAYVTATVVPLLDHALIAVAEGSDDAVKMLAELATAFAGRPLFCTVDEFDTWMSDDDLALVLNPNTRSAGRDGPGARTRSLGPALPNRGPLTNVVTLFRFRQQVAEGALMEAVRRNPFRR